MSVIKGWWLEIDRSNLELVCATCSVTAARYDTDPTSDPITLERVLADAQAHDVTKHSTEGGG